MRTSPAARRPRWCGSPPARRCRACGCPSARRRARLAGQRTRLVAVGRLAHHLDVVLGVEQARNPARTRAWSSASSTLITCHPSWSRPAGSGPHAEAPAGPGPRLGGAAQRLRPLAHPGDAAPPSPRSTPAPWGRAGPAPVPSSSTCTSSSRACAAPGPWRGWPRRGAPRWSAPPGRCGRRPGPPRRAAPVMSSAGTARPSPLPARPHVEAGAAGPLGEPSRSASPAVGASGAASPWRSTSSTDRSSPSASLLASLMAASAGRTCSGSMASGFSSTRCSATPAAR